MSDQRREQTIKNMKEMSPDQFFAGMPQNTSIKKEEKSSKFKEKLKGFFEILGALGLFPVFSSSSKSSGRRGRAGGGYSAPQQQSGTTFKESYHFDPERAYLERIQERTYMQMVDGRGDPQHCDCDHDR